MLVKPLLVGEQNPYGDDPRFALYPSPRGCAGWRLCHLVLGLDEDEYLERFDRENLVVGPRWSMTAARRQASVIVSASADRTVILLGSKVSAAFGDPCDKMPFSCRWLAETPAPQFVFLPHPSGRCRAWNVPGNFERARRLLRRVGVL